METDLTETYLKAAEVAQLLKLSLVTIRRYTASNTIPCYRINRAVRYKRSEVEKWIEGKEAASAGNQNGKNCDGGKE